jgi:hypothetical protein
MNREGIVGLLWWIFLAYISKSVALYKGYVETGHERNMNIGQYYS